MYPPIFATVAASSAVKALIGTPPRFYPFGKAPQPGTNLYAKPYVTWQLIGAQPENYLGRVPDMDQFTVQVDVWADTADSARDVTVAVRDAVEPVAYVTAWRGESREAGTNLYRVSFDVEFLTPR